MRLLVIALLTTLAFPGVSAFAQDLTVWQRAQKACPEGTRIYDEASKVLDDLPVEEGPNKAQIHAESCAAFKRMPFAIADAERTFGECQSHGAAGMPEAISFLEMTRDAINAGLTACN